MFKLLIILLIGLAFESAGVVLLKKGMTHISEVKGYTLAEGWRVAKAAATSPQICLGLLFEAIFFGSLILLMSKSDISFLWPMTGLSFVFATFAAIVFLGESVSGIRWAGVVLVMLGAALISFSEHQKSKGPEPATAARSNSTGLP